jgi:hypothetical protein
VKFIIKDWAGNVLDFKGRIERPEFAVAMEFATYEDAYEYLVERLADLADEQGLDEYHVEEVESSEAATMSKANRGAK